MRMLGSHVVFFISMTGRIFAIIDEKYQQFYNEMLDVHNKYRAIHNVKPLYLDKKLSVEPIILFFKRDLNITIDLTRGVNFHSFPDPTKMRFTLLDVAKTEKNAAFTNMSSFLLLEKSVELYGRVVFIIVNVVLEMSTFQNIDHMNLCEIAATYLITKEDEAALKNNYGTNFYFNSKHSELNARKMCECWYEKKDDDSYKEIPGLVIYKEPFTNIVWEGTTKIGVAVFEDTHFDVILVIYDPRGDISEEPQRNDKKFRSKMLQDVDSKIVRQLF